MALDTPSPAIAVEKAITDDSSYVDWPAIIAGAVLATAISVVLLTFGSAIGLSMTSPIGGEGVSLFWVAIITAAWVVWVQLSAFMAGGYVTGRLRRRKLDATEHESDVRDGAHGLLVWGTGVVFTAVLALGGFAGAVGAITSAAGNAAGAAVAAADGASDTDPFGYAVDVLFRANQPAPADTDDARAEAGRIVAQSVMTGTFTAEDRAYLAALAASRTGISQEEAEARVDAFVAQAEAVEAEARETANQARIIGVLAAFLTAAALAASAAGAYFAAGAGGNHRDKNTVIPGFGRFV